MKRYHPALVVLHWLILLGLFISLFGGSQMLAPVPNSDPLKVEGLRNHMILANTIFVLMSLRLIIRIKTQVPADADIGVSLLNKGAKLAHYFLYILVFAMVATGWTVAIATDLPGIVFMGSDTPLPENFNDLAARMAHGVISKLLIFLIIAHGLAALYHQFVRKDKLMSRMWFGKRSE